MILGTCGFGSTGSSAVSDYLLEFDSVQVLDKKEFTLVAEPDGLIDLEYHLMHPHYKIYDCKIAIYRFQEHMKRIERGFTRGWKVDKITYNRITEDFINKITTVKWKDILYAVDSPLVSYLERVYSQKVIAKIERILNRPIVCFPMTDVYLSVQPENFYIAAKEFVAALLTEMGADRTKRMIILDQPFGGNNPQAAFPFFDDPYAIVVDRDPRDNYVFSQTKLLGRNHSAPLNNVQDFVLYYKSVRDNQPYKQEHERVMRIQFEEMVYNYDTATSRIREFLRLPENPRPRTVFDPNLSVANTQVFKKFPQFYEDVKYIETHLQDYLFDFDKYPAPVAKGGMFSGRSPLHK